MWNWFKNRAKPRGSPGDSTPTELRGASRHPTDKEVNLIWRRREGVDESLRATMENASRSGLGLTTAKEFELGQILFVGRNDAELVKAVVRYCIPESASGWQVGLKVIENDRRRADRAATEGACQISWTGDGGNRVVASGKVENVSEFGAQVRSHDVVPVGEAVRVGGEGSAWVGTIRYCVQRRDGYLLGVYFFGDAQTTGPAPRARL